MAVFNPKTWTLATDHDGDLTLDSLNRPKIVRGTSAAHQDLSVAIKSDKGEDPIDPAFGLDKFAMQDSITAAEREIRDTLEHDERVSSVPSVEIWVPPGRREGAQVQAIVVLRSDAEPEPYEIVFDLSSGSVSFGGGFGF